MDKPLWAPWRMEFIRAERPDGCIFCDFPAQDVTRDRENLIVHRSSRSFTILNRFPYNAGHLMVIPRAHVADFARLEREELADLHDELRRAIEVLKRVAQPEGLNVGMNLGKVAGAGIVDHMHYHVVPRWAGDNNFMPVLADVRVVVEHLDATWERVRAGFASL
jgi:ATP adenylyltransferase